MADEDLTHGAYAAFVRIGAFPAGPCLCDEHRTANPPVLLDRLGMKVVPGRHVSFLDYVKESQQPKN